MKKKDVARSVHQQLLNIRDKSEEEFNHLLMRYGLERLLYRLAESGSGEDFVLKGAMLFALWQNVPGRPTRDVDLLGFGDINHERLNKVFSDACNAEVIDDGLHYDTKSVVTQDIRDEQEYHGIRVRLLAYLGNARIPIQVDVGFGDAITPAPTFINYPAILDYPTPRLRAYHPATVIAEKLNAMIVLGLMNSRLKDFYDIHVILRHMNVQNSELEIAIKSTFERRKTKIPNETPIVFTPEFLIDGTKEVQWKAFLRRIMVDYDLTLNQVINDIHSSLGPIIQKLASKVE